MDEIEIPEAIREDLELPQKSPTGLSLPLIFGMVFCLGIVGLLSMMVLSPRPQPALETAEQPPAPAPSSLKKTSAKPPIAKEAESSLDEAEVDSAQTQPRGLLGHLPYDVAPPESLEPITSDGRLKMRSAAAKKFIQMQADARAEGINLTAVSAFRTTEVQEQLFFGIKEQRAQDAAKRAEVSAPPGYSEHHTGYAIDIGDANAPSTHVEVEFADTAAFAWLEKNAAKYSFELSFPLDNEQGVSYEPWHWRFVGDRHSLETFYKVRN
ncbi:MAG: M15 family metallopeptidase [Cyanobacteria bacterium P01_G01_bin.19]